MHVAEALQLKRADGIGLGCAQARLATGSRAARIAGNSPPMRPITHAQIMPSAMSPGVTVSAKTICVNCRRAC